MAFFLFGILFLVVCVAAGAGPPANYLAARAHLVAEADALRFDATSLDTGLDAAERLVNASLMALKQQERNASVFLPATPFHTAKTAIRATALFAALEKLPKGGVLHLHWDSALSTEWAVNATYGAVGDSAVAVMFTGGAAKAARGSFGRRRSSSSSSSSPRYNDMRFVEAAALPAARKAGWEPLAELRSAYGAGFDAAVVLNLTMGESDFEPASSPWEKFQGYFGAVAGVLTYRPVFERYLAAVFDSFYSKAAGQNVQYAELRFATGGLYDFEGGAAYSGVDMARLAGAAAAAAVQRSSGRFYGTRLIPAGFRGADAKGAAADIAATLGMQTAHPELVVGYDLVGQEDGGWDLLHHASALLAAQVAVAKDTSNNGTLGLYLHAGETSWGGRGAPGCTDADDGPGSDSGGSSVCSASTGAAARNLFDAALLARRIGHGLALPKYPTLMRRVADVQTSVAAIEVCPISNQVLNYVSDMRDHPATAMLAAGVPITLSPDDPAPLGYTSVTFDWWLAFVAWDIDLAGLKQLALNSIAHSALLPPQRAQLTVIWQREWASFIHAYAATLHGAR